MGLTYKSCNNAASLTHTCDPCDLGEKGRVRSIFLYKKTYDPTATANLTEAAWTAAIEAGNIIIVPKTSGTFDGGTAKTITGFGDKMTRKIGDDYTLAFKEPNYAENIDFWQNMEQEIENGNFCFGWRTDTLLHFSGTSIANQSLAMKAPVEDDVESVVVWNGEAKWFSASKPTSISITPVKDLFSCFEVDTTTN